jgi:spore coat polysaccharide biosynthesis protein SpsF (cytidylyltransferase family)
LFKIKNFKHSENLSSWRWTLDNIKDWQFIEKIYERFYDEDHFFTYQSVISFLKDNPGILKINCDTVRNAGYLKSILEEKGEFKCN